MTGADAQGTERPLDLQHPSHWRLRSAHGVFNNLHATHARYHDDHLDASFGWWGRRQRKGRRVQVYGKPDRHRVVWHWPWLFGIELGNISWWVAMLFTTGSAVWCVNGWYALFPLSDATTNANILGWTALVGGTLFEAGAYCMVAEALNRGNTVRFGYEVRNLLEAGLTEFHRAPGGGFYQHGQKPGSVQKASARSGHQVLAVDSSDVKANGGGKGTDAAAPKQKWRWWGYKWNSLGYLASFITFIGASTFWIATIVGVPNALPDEATHVVEWDILYWLTQVLGSCCFITGALLFMLEEQPSWWRIRPHSLGWQVGFWNLIGGVGFWLSGFFGFYAYPAGEYQRWGTSLSTFWGSWAFLIGSYIQLVETLN